jgi:hypothetical protein
VVAPYCFEVSAFYGLHLGKTCEMVSLDDGQADKGNS